LVITERPSLDSLASFAILAEELHFTRAALRLHVAQPALTKRIRQLEARLGCDLFERSKRHVRLTVAGEQLLPAVHQVLRAVDGLTTDAARVHQGIARLRIGFTPSAPHDVLPQLLHRFRTQRPEVQCVLTEASSDRQITQLLEGTLDLGVLRPPLKRVRGLTFVPFLDEPFVAVLPRQHRLAARPHVPLRELADEALVLVSRAAGATVHAQIVAACDAAGFAPRVGQNASSATGVVGLVAAGCGVAVLPRSATSPTRGVAIRPLSGTTLRTVIAVVHPTRQKTPAVSAFVRSARL
jgi:DNA-binding transcriptional LysR family regulator